MYFFSFIEKNFDFLIEYLSKAEMKSSTKEPYAIIFKTEATTPYFLSESCYVFGNIPISQHFSLNHFSRK